jgi:hypothetical protein
MAGIEFHGVKPAPVHGMQRAQVGEPQVSYLPRDGGRRGQVVRGATPWGPSLRGSPLNPPQLPLISLGKRGLSEIHMFVRNGLCTAVP